MPCTDERVAAFGAPGAWRGATRMTGVTRATSPKCLWRVSARAWLLVAALLAGCASQAPPPPAAPAAPGTSTRPPEPAETPLPPRSTGPTLPAPAAARNWVEFKTNAGRRLVAASPDRSYLGDPPSVLFGIPVIETELYVDGTIKSIRVVREPTNPAARDTVQIAIAAIRRAAPYGDMTRLSRPWKWVEAFLFDDRRHFKPQSLDE